MHLKIEREVRRRYPEMDNQNIRTILAVFTSTHNQLVLLLDALLNDNKQVTHTPYEFRHQIRQLSYFCLIHSSDLVCHESTRMDIQTFFILCHLLRTIAGLTSIEIVDVEEMVAMFLHILVHDVKNKVIQRDFVRSGETVSRHFNLVLLAMLRLHDELLKKPQPMTNTCTDSRWSCSVVRILLYHVTYQSPRPVTNWVVCHTAELPWGIG